VKTRTDRQAHLLWLITPSFGARNLVKLSERQLRRCRDHQARDILVERVCVSSLHTFVLTPIMSTLRRRIFGGDDSASRDVSPAPPAPKEAGGDAFRIVSNEKFDALKKSVKPRSSKKRNAWVFTLGGLFGLFVAGFFASRDGALDKLVSLAGLEDMNLDNLYDVLPAGLIRDVQNMQVRIVWLYDWRGGLFPWSP
jgi:phospholipid:diacylglycerol acyltransferase